MTLDQLTAFLGWCTLINIGILAFSAILLMIGKDTFSALHGKMFGLDQKDVKVTYYNYLGTYKIAIIVFNLVPYLALRIIAS